MSDNIVRRLNLSRSCRDWTPAPLSPYGWWDASDQSTIAESGGFVSQWDNKGTASANLVQGTGANQPSYPYSMNGLNGVRSLFQDWVLKSGLTDTFTNVMMISVCMIEDGVYANLHDISGTTDRITVRRRIGTSNLNIPYSISGNSGELTSIGSFTVADPFMMSVIYDGSTLEAFQNGTSVGSAGSLSGTFDLDQVRVGWIENGDTDTSVGEIVLIDSSDVDTRQKIEGYMAHKWGLEGDLPSGHPYKSSAPCI